MRRLVRLEPAEPTIFSESRCRTRKAPAIDGFGVRLSKPGKGSSCSITQCGNCGGEVKVFVSPRRNPHSNKLGRAVSMKDHDLCRRCWRRVMQKQRKEGVIILPLSMFIGGDKIATSVADIKSGCIAERSLVTSMMIEQISFGYRRKSLKENLGTCYERSLGLLDKFFGKPGVLIDYFECHIAKFTSSHD